jgi:hypothetical protein
MKLGYPESIHTWHRCAISAQNERSMLVERVHRKLAGPFLIISTMSGQDKATNVVIEKHQLWL